MEYINYYSQLWDEAMIKHSDPRTTNWFLLSSFLPTALICFGYVILVQYVLPLLMEGRKPFQLKKCLIVYNFSMVALSSYIFYEFLMSGWLNDYSYVCAPVDRSNSPKALRMTRVCWVFYISKFIELLDTVFFVLRKKYNQVTFLHVFHHSTMPMNWWFAVKFVPGGHGSFHALLNSFIHIVMYTYYGIAALGPEYQKYLGWKKLMTTMQMIQFFAVLYHATQLWFIDCDFPKIFVIWIMTGALVFIVFFANFYIHEYYLKKKAANALRNGNHSRKVD